MIYTPNVPQSGTFLGNTRNAILMNFQTLNTWSAVNHYPLNATDAGKHTFCSFPVQASDPATAVGECALYSKTGTNPARANLFLRGENNNFVYQLTRTQNTSSINNIFGLNTVYTYVGKPAAATATAGWTFLPGGLIMQYGTLTGPTSSGTLLFPFAFPGGAPFMVQLTIANNVSGGQVVLNNASLPTATEFSYLIAGSGVTLYWTAIGL